METICPINRNHTCNFILIFSHLWLPSIPYYFMEWASATVSFFLRFAFNSQHTKYEIKKRENSIKCFHERRWYHIRIMRCNETTHTKRHQRQAINWKNEGDITAEWEKMRKAGKEMKKKISISIHSRHYLRVEFIRCHIKIVFHIHLIGF